MSLVNRPIEKACVRCDEIHPHRVMKSNPGLLQCQACGGAVRAKAHVLNLDAQVRGEEEDTQGPAWTCADCGSARNHGITYPSTPNGPEEYDMVCDDCGSLEIAESPEEAANVLGLKLDECRAEIAQQREEIGRLGPDR